MSRGVDIILFSLSGLIVGITCIVLVFILIVYGRSLLHRLFALFNLAVAWWGIFSFLIGRANDPEYCLLLFKIAHVGIIFIAVFFYHFSSSLTGIKRKFLIIFAYSQGIFFTLLSLLNLEVPFVSYVEEIKDSFYYLRSTGFIYPLFLFIWILLVVLALVEVYLKFRTERNYHKKNQLGYFLFWFFVGFSGGLSNFVPVFYIDFVPLGNFTAPLYCIIITYAILKYQLLDIRITVTRVGIFVFVYSLILGIPFGLTFWGKENLVSTFGQHWHWAPIILSTVFATAGPFIFLYFQRKAEENLLQEEQRVQNLLMQASYGMNTIHNLERLLELIVTITIKTLRVDSGKIFLLNREGDKYELRMPAENDGFVFDRDDPLVEQLRQKQYPIIHDEIKMFFEMNAEAKLKEVESKMCELSAHMIVPITLKDSLVGFLALGERESKDMYSKGLLNALSVLGHQAAIAIDRCIYLEAETKRLEEEGLKERMVSLDHMASSMAHEIDNPMHSLNVTVGYIRDLLLRDPRVRFLPEEVINEFKEALTRIQMAGERVSGMVKAILDYSKMGKGELQPVVFKEAVEGFKFLKMHEITKEQIHFDLQLEDNLPPVLGDRIQLEEIFMNFVNNSMHAVRRKEEKNVALKIFKKDYKTIRIECIDNGYGIEKEFLNDMFLFSTTTKGSSEGTGIGLYRVRKIVDRFGGKVWGESEGKDKGTRLIVEFPIYDGDKIAKIDILQLKKKDGAQNEEIKH